MTRSAAVLVLLALGAGAAPAAAATGAALLRLEKPGRGQLMSAALEVSAPVELTVEAVGSLPAPGEEPFATAWILDATTRRAVWSLDEREREMAADSRFLCRAADRVRLAPGRYAVYLFGGSRWRTAPPFRSFGNLLNDLANIIGHANTRSNADDLLASCFVSLTAVGSVPPAAVSRLPRDSRATAPGTPSAGALIDLTRAPRDTVLAASFRLARATTLHLRACGESSADTTRLLDFGWIENAVTGEPAWMMEAKQTRRAGGARKNRLFDGEVQLPAGDYIARFATDGSHAWGEWNAVPPPDPDAWGLAIFAGAGCAAGDLQPLAPTQVHRAPGVLASLLLARDNDDRRESFTLTRPTRVKIEALLEGRGDEMADRAWIIASDTGRKAWTLAYDQTEPAGGAAKNRRFSGEIELPAGSYEARVRCDDSHAFGSWNDTPPPQPWKWGLSVRVAGD